MAVVSPSEFGAVADGATNNTTALQAWLDEPNVIHWLPDGVWVTDPLDVPESCWIMGVGTLRLRTQNLTTLGDHALLECLGTSGNHHTGTRITGITLDPNRTAHSGTPNANMEAIGLDYCDGVVVDSVTIVNAIADAVDLDNCDRCHISRCYIKDGGKGGVHFSGGTTRSTAEFNVVDNVGLVNTDRAGVVQVETASDNLFFGNRVVNSNKGYEILGSGAVGVGNVSADNDNADETTGADSWT